MPTAAIRIRQYLTQKNARSSSSSSSLSEPDASTAGSNGNGRRAVPSSSVSTTVSTRTSPRSSPSRRGNSRNNGTRPRRRLQRGWWPDAQKRAERSFQAMQDLKDATFVSNKYQNSTVVVTRVVIIYLYRLIMCAFSTLYLCCICILFG